MQKLLLINWYFH